MKKSALELIRPEDKGKRAVGAFNIFNPATVRGVFGAAEDAAVAVIFQLSQSLVTRYGVAYCVEMVDWRAGCILSTMPCTSTTGKWMNWPVWFRVPSIPTPATPVRKSSKRYLWSPCRRSTCRRSYRRREKGTGSHSSPTACPSAFWMRIGMKHLNGDFLFMHADTYFENKILEMLIEKNGEIVLFLKRAWPRDQNSLGVAIAVLSPMISRPDFPTLRSARASNPARSSVPLACALQVTEDGGEWCPASRNT